MARTVQERIARATPLRIAVTGVVLAAVLFGLGFAVARVNGEAPAVAAPAPLAKFEVETRPVPAIGSVGRLKALPPKPKPKKRARPARPAQGGAAPAPAASAPAPATSAPAAAAPAAPAKSRPAAPKPQAPAPTCLGEDCGTGE